MSDYTPDPRVQSLIRNETQALQILGRYSGIRKGREPEDPFSCLSPEVDGHEFWLGSFQGDGAKHHGKSAFRKLYALSGHDIDDDENVTHTCAEPTCGNPDHLIAVIGIPRFVRAKKPAIFAKYRNVLTAPHPLLHKCFIDQNFRSHHFPSVPADAWERIFRSLEYTA